MMAGVVGRQSTVLPTVEQKMKREPFSAENPALLLRECPLQRYVFCVEQKINPEIQPNVNGRAPTFAYLRAWSYSISTEDRHFLG